MQEPFGRSSNVPVPRRFRCVLVMLELVLELRFRLRFGGYRIAHKVYDIVELFYRVFFMEGMAEVSVQIFFGRILCSERRGVSSGGRACRL